MAFVCTKVQAYGIESEEAINKRYRQYLILTITAANTDIALDLDEYVSGSLGTFWNAVDATATGVTALAAMADIAGTRAEQFLDIQSEALAILQKIDSSQATITKLDSAVSVGGAASETMTVTGLLTTDVLLAVTQFVDGDGAAVGILAYGGATGVCSVAGELAVVWNADPGASAKVRVAVQRAAATSTPADGQFSMTVSGKAPDVLFNSGSAPTAYTVVLSWILKPGHSPVEVYAAA